MDYDDLLKVILSMTPEERKQKVMFSTNKTLPTVDFSVVDDVYQVGDDFFMIPQ
jgi:hypothetical protein